VDENPYELVFTMSDYYDGPRGGLANYLGKPHQYKSLWGDFDKDMNRSDNPDIFELRPVPDETLALELEDWNIWLRWQATHKAGNAAVDTHPALPEDRARHEHLKILLKERMSQQPVEPTVYRTGTFSVIDGQIFVQWKEVPESHPWFADLDVLKSLERP